LANILKGAEDDFVNIYIPKFKINSELDGVSVLKELGVQKVFGNEADLSKISSLPLSISTINHSTAIETDEFGTEAASVNVVECLIGDSLEEPPSLVFDRPFLF
ncbi:hypothetical protein PENTCL1PPCAC_22442, partial [Pristionchus entomophagus]